MHKNAHYFYALRLPIEVKNQLKQQCESMKELLSFNRWVHHEDVHITLAFLGNAAEEKLTDSIEYVRKELEHQPAFSLTINRIGIFGRKDSPRIFWAGVEKQSSLDKVRNSVFQACIKAGFTLETRPFSPHITLARKWQGEKNFSNELLQQHNPFKDVPVVFTARDVVLYRTHLDRVPKYESIEVFPLKP